MILQVAADHLVGGTHTDDRGGAGRDGAGIDGGEIAPGRQHVQPATAGRAGRPRGDASAIESGEQCMPLRLRARADGYLDLRPDIGLA